MVSTGGGAQQCAATAGNKAAARNNAPQPPGINRWALLTTGQQCAAGGFELLYFDGGLGVARTIGLGPG